ncbi:glycosyltransferase family 2 protein [Halomicrobium salinisoli]|uniref:glycosyltransferase family 2 protein n=1 Tax=Halomicrobium salinisoli TaxID=2878391 RepID=UPI003B82CAB6
MRGIADQRKRRRTGATVSQTTDSSAGGPSPSLDRDSVAEQYIVGPDSEVTPVLSVVMPTLNEEEGIVECIDWIKTAVEELEVPTEIVVSDSSTDRTPDLAEERGAIVVTPDEPGYGYAYRYAFERTRGEYVVMGDADTTYDFEEIPRLLEPVRDGDADICMGSRLDGEIRSGAMPPLHQYIGNPLLTRFLNTFYDAGVSDAHSGFRVFSREALETLDLETTGMEFASEMIMDAGAKGLAIEEVPIVYHEREGEETLDSFSDGWRHVRFMLVNAPGYLFSAPGVLLGLFGTVVMALAYSGTAVNGVAFGVHSMIAGSLCLIAGLQAFSLGVFATVGTDPIQRPDDVLTNWIVENATLERGATLGAVVFALGAVQAGYLVWTWVSSGFGNLSFTLGSMVAFTALVVGMQAFFGSFFLSVVGDR